MVAVENVIVCTGELTMPLREKYFTLVPAEAGSVWP